MNKDEKPAGTAPMCERKTAQLEREGYVKTGYVLRQPGMEREVVVSDGGAVSWFTLEQWNWLMFNRDQITFQWPSPIGDRAAEPARAITAAVQTGAIGDAEVSALLNDLERVGARGAGEIPSLCTWAGAVIRGLRPKQDAEQLS